MTEKKKKKSETGDQAGDDGIDQTQVKKIQKKSKPAKKTTYATKTNDEYLFSFGNLFK